MPIHDLRTHEVFGSGDPVQCPACGSNPVICGGYGEGESGYYLRCSKLESETSGPACPTTGPVGGGILDAIAGWNELAAGGGK